MRWDRLFDDLSAQAAALERTERSAEIQERFRIETAQLHLVDRLAAAIGSYIRMDCSGGLTLRGVLSRCAPTWLLIDEGSGREALVPSAAVRTVAGIGRFARSADAVGAIEARLSVASALRGVARDRLPVRLHLRGGSAVDGTIDRVGADFVELAAHAAGEWRRPDEVRGTLLVAFAELAAVRRAGVG